MDDQKLRIIPLGGLGEVGKNMLAVEYGERILVVDAGLMFPENDMLGIDYIIPDFQYLLDKLDWIRGVVITHGLEDHTGAIAHLMERINAPIYATPLRRGLVAAKLSRGGLINKVRLNTVQAGDTVWHRPVPSGVFPHVPFHPRRGGAGHHHQRRAGSPLRRLQIRPHPSPRCRWMRASQKPWNISEACRRPLAAD